MTTEAEILRSVPPASVAGPENVRPEASCAGMVSMSQWRTAAQQRRLRDAARFPHSPDAPGHQQCSELRSPALQLSAREPSPYYIGVLLLSRSPPPARPTVSSPRLIRVITGSLIPSPGPDTYLHIGQCKPSIQLTETGFSETGSIWSTLLSNFEGFFPCPSSFYA